MHERITTAKLSDLVQIFDPKAQEIDETGGARIFYTYTEDGDTIRERVGEVFELEVLEQGVGEPLIFEVNLRQQGPLQDGVISLISPQFDDLPNTEYQLTKEGIQQLIFDVGTVIGLEDIDVILKLLEDQK